MNFWDSSALLPLVVEEALGEKMALLLSDQESRYITWWGARTEIGSALARKAREGTLDTDQLFRAINRARTLIAASLQIQPIDRVADRAERLLLTHSLRSADSLQLAAAIIATSEEPQGNVFVCLDQRLSTAARLEGFTIIPTES